MPSYVYEEDVIDLDEALVVSASDIEACKSGPVLQEWMDDLEVHIDHIRAQLDAARLSGKRDDAWVFRASRALGYFNIGCGRIKRRMKEIGWSSRSQEGAILELQRKLQTAKAEAAYGRAFAKLAAEFLPPAEFERLDREAIAAIEPRKEAT